MPVQQKKKWKIYAVDIIWADMYLDVTLAAQEQKVANNMYSSFC